MRRFPRLLIPILLLATIASCRPGSELIGTYHANDPSTGAVLQLVLNAEGKGHWIVSRENIAFSWEARGNEVWLHSRTGGVVVGRIEKHDCIDVALPGVGRFRFERVKG
jgi:hypothetical protein